MSSLVSDAQNNLLSRLQEAELDDTRFVKLRKGTKESYLKHTKPENQFRLNEISGNYGVMAGNGLVILDIDVSRENFPAWITNLPSTFVVESPHGGFHLYYLVKDDAGISNTKTVDWGSVRYDGWYGTGPDSSINHQNYCDDREDCPGQGTGEYAIAVDNPIAILSGEHLEQLRKICDSNGDKGTQSRDYGRDKLTFPDENTADEGERYICTEFAQQATELANRDLMDFLRGGTGSYGLRRDDGTGIDQSAADFYALDMLYGAFRFRGEDEEDAMRLGLAVFKRYCLENTFDKTGNLRKWLQRGEGYLQEQSDSVQQRFDFGEWHRWRRRKYKGGYDRDKHKPWANPATDGIASLVTRDTIHATLQILALGIDTKTATRLYGLAPPDTTCGEMCTPRSNSRVTRTHGHTSQISRHYPTASEVGNVASELNPERKASYFEETVRKLARDTDRVAHAYCPCRPNGERHVYYPATKADPEDARWVKVNGEKHSEET